MKVVIQHNFTSGLGDFIADVSHYLTILEPLKKNGYEIHLRIALRGNKYTDGPFFKELFDEETVNFFTSIEELNETASGDELEGCKYYVSNHNPQKPGYHHFDLFFDIPPDNFICKRFDAQVAYSDSIFPKILPKFNKNVLDKVEEFHKKIPENYFFLHIRTSDIIDSDTERYDKIINNVKKFINETNYNIHLGTNNKYIFKNLKDYKNIYTFDFKNFDLVNNDMNAFTNGYDSRNLKTEILNERMLEICAEIASISKVSKIFCLHDVSWISNFLFYPICKRNNEIELINKNTWAD